MYTFFWGLMNSATKLRGCLGFRGVGRFQGLEVQGSRGALGAAGVWEGFGLSRVPGSCRASPGCREFGYWILVDFL